MSSTEPELVAGIVAAPDEDGPRIVYADWLSDRDDPRGELIVVQCALARADRDDAPAHETIPLGNRALELLQLHRETWLAPVLDVAVSNYHFRRGFIEVMDVLQPRIDGRALRAACPLLRAIKVPQALLGDLFSYIDAIPTEELTLYRITDGQSVRRVFEEPRLATLRRLDVHYQSDRPHLAELAMLAIPLHRLGLRFDRTQPFDQPGLLDSLVTHPARQALRSLELVHARTGDLGALERMPELEELTLSSCPCDLRQLHDLRLPALTALAITDGAMDKLDLVALLATFPKLRRLRLAKTGLGDRAALALAGSPDASRLRRLDLSSNQITATGARALAGSEHLRDLVWLDLKENTNLAELGEDLRRTLVHADVCV